MTKDFFLLLLKSNYIAKNRKPEAIEVMLGKKKEGKGRGK